jgi:hypothetical protein
MNHSSGEQGMYNPGCGFCQISAGSKAVQFIHQIAFRGPPKREEGFPFSPGFFHLGVIVFPIGYGLKNAEACDRVQQIWKSPDAKKSLEVTRWRK